MKNILASIIFFFAFAFTIQAQIATEVYVMDFGTVANATYETGYFDYGSWAKSKGFLTIDSIHVGVFVKNETDIDSIDLYMGFEGFAGGAQEAYAAVLGTYISTIDVADGASGYQSLLVSGATLLSAANIRGYNSVKVNLGPNFDSGNDATDPNRAAVVFYVYGSKK